jgi:Leucine-rich repeat (LRR) protein
MKKITLLFVLLVLVCWSYGQVDRNRERWITNLDEAFVEPERVYNLDLSGRGLDSISNYLTSFHNLEAVKLSDNRIRATGDQLSGLRKLQFLELSGNNLRQVDYSKLGQLKFSLG